MTRRFVALDRDGTLIVERHYLSDPSEVELLPGAARGLCLLRALGLGLVVVTNQSAVGRGLIDLAQLARIHRRMRDLLQDAGADVDAIYYCPHTPDDGCVCRKPRTGMLDQAARELGFAPRESFVIGDKACDIELGRQVGATTFLVRTGYGAAVAAAAKVKPCHVVDGVLDAAWGIERLIKTDQRTAFHVP